MAQTVVLKMKKTEFMTFGTRQRLVRQKCDETDISLNGQFIKHTNTFKYVGVVLDDTLSFNDHVDYVRMKVSKTLGMFSRIRPSGLLWDLKSPKVALNNHTF